MHVQFEEIAEEVSRIEELSASLPQTQLGAMWQSALIEAIGRGAETFLRALWDRVVLDELDAGFEQYKVQGRYLVDHAESKEQQQLIPMLVEKGAFVSDKTLRAFALNPELLSAWLACAKEAIAEGPECQLQVCCAMDNTWHTVCGW